MSSGLTLKVMSFASYHAAHDLSSSRCQESTSVPDFIVKKTYLDEFSSVAHSLLQCESVIFRS